MLRALFLLISLIAITNFVKAQAAVSWWPFPGSHHYRQLSPACEAYGKRFLSRWEIDSAEELSVLINACRGNGDASCIKTITSPLSRWDYDDLQEFALLARSCRGSDVGCILWVKSKLPRFDFDDPNEVATVASSCFATDMDCVARVCAADRWACDEDHEYLQIARTCSSPHK